MDPGYDRGVGYDDINRLTTANSGAKLWGPGSYQYDAMGNMLSLSLGTHRTATFSYAGTTPKLWQVVENGTPSSVSYDAAGNETIGERMGSHPEIQEKRNVGSRGQSFRRFVFKFWV